MDSSPHPPEGTRNCMPAPSMAAPSTAPIRSSHQICWEMETSRYSGSGILDASGAQSIVERLAWGTRPGYRQEHRWPRWRRELACAAFETSGHSRHHRRTKCQNLSKRTCCRHRWTPKVRVHWCRLQGKRTNNRSCGCRPPKQERRGGGPRGRQRQW